jgi:hypothetical protein
MTEKKQILVRNIDEDLRRRFKAICAEEGTNMNAVILRLIARYVEKKEAEEKQHRFIL